MKIAGGWVNWLLLHTLKEGECYGQMSFNVRCTIRAQKVLCIICLGQKGKYFLNKMCHFQYDKFHIMRKFWVATFALWSHYDLL